MKTNQVGFGIQGGSLSGANAQFWLSESRAVSAAIAYDGGNTALTLAHTWIARGAFGAPVSDFAPFWGVGLVSAIGRNRDIFLRGDQNFAFGAQAPLGIEYLPSAMRFSIFGEVSPTFEVTPVATLVLTADLGARFFF